MVVIVVGCGRQGSNLAVRLAQGGHQVTVIDEEPEALERLPEDFPGERVVGTGIDMDVLREAGIEQADALAAMTSRDNTNIMIARIAEVIFHVPRVVARINDPLRESVFHAFGISTVCPITLASEAVMKALLSEEAH